MPPSAAAWDHDNHEKKTWNHCERDNRGDRGHYRRQEGSRFRDEHVRMMRDYYGPQLPPGLHKKYYRTGQLPPGWQKKIRPFPRQLERRLPPLCGGCARGYVDGYAVVYQPRTGLVIDFHAVLAP